MLLCATNIDPQNIKSELQKIPEESGKDKRDKTSEIDKATNRTSSPAQPAYIYISAQPSPQPSPDISLPSHSLTDADVCVAEVREQQWHRVHILEESKRGEGREGPQQQIASEGKAKILKGNNVRV